MKKAQANTGSTGRSARGSAPVSQTGIPSQRRFEYEHPTTQKIHDRIFGCRTRPGGH
jgi:hypothetical protein